MPNPTERVRRKVVIVDNHPVVREYLAALLREEADLEVCGDAADLPTALAAIDRNEPDLMILEVSSKSSQGLDSLRQLKALHPKLPVLALSLNAGRLYAERALEAGAAGYLSKQEATVDILPAIRKILAGPAMVNSHASRQPLERQLIDEPATLKHG